MLKKIILSVKQKHKLTAATLHRQRCGRGDSLRVLLILHSTFHGSRIRPIRSRWLTGISNLAAPSVSLWQTRIPHLISPSSVLFSSSPPFIFIFLPCLSYFLFLFPFITYHSLLPLLLFFFLPFSYSSFFLHPLPFLL